MVTRVNRFFQNQLFQNLLFWSVSFLVLLRLFTRTDQPRQIDYLYTALFHLPLLAAVFLNSLVLIPRSLSKGYFWQYIWQILGLYGLTYLIYFFTFNYLADWLFPGFFFIAIYTPIEILGVFVIYVGITSLIEFSKSWFREMELEKKMESLQKEKVETELKALRAQINPHFLFNSLNHIYSLAYRQSPETAPAVLQLSDLLRYTLKQMDKTEVPLQDELNYLQKYVTLYKNRLRHPEKVYFEIQGPVEGLIIAPLMLIAFVENCFKHGSIEAPGETIDIEIEISSNRLIMKTRNSTASKAEIPESSGIGLENVRRRLNLLYLGKYSLLTEQNGSIFFTKLELELK